MRKHRWRILVFICLALLLVSGWMFRRQIRYMVMNRTLTLPPSVASVLAKHEEAVRQEFEPICARQGIEWPPRRIQLLAFKKEALLEVWVANPGGPFARLSTFPILGMSGGSGPKRKSGDMQVPEGFYPLTHLNPQSGFHLSIRVDYPNVEDVRNAIAPPDLMGGDIYIHGRKASIGCLAMGDPAIEKIFCLVAMSNPGERNIVIAPVDFRSEKSVSVVDADPWVQDLYARISDTLSEFKL